MLFYSGISNYSLKGDSEEFNKKSFFKEISKALKSQYYYFNKKSLSDYKNEFEAEYERIKSKEDLAKFINSYFTSLGDNHSKMLTINQASQALSQNVKVSIPNLENSSDGTFYILVPKLHSMNDSVNKSFSSSIRKQLLLQVDSTSKGLIIDLRGNHGGDFRAFISAFSILFPDQTLFRTLSKEGKETIHLINNKEYYVFNNNLKTNRIAGKPKSNKNSNLENIPLVVLIDGETSSSAEWLSYSLKKRKNTTLIGQPTKGLMDGNTVFKFSDNSLMFFVKSVVVEDLPNNSVVKNVTPNIISDGDNIIDLAKKKLCY